MPAYLRDLRPELWPAPLRGEHVVGWRRTGMRAQGFARPVARRQDSFIFQDLGTRLIIEAVLADHAMANWRWDATQALKTHSRCTQYQESDAAFITRLLALEGLSWHLEQLQGDAAAAADATFP